MKHLFLIWFSFALSACQTDSASHLPAPWQLPGAALGSAIENTVYGARRRKVQNFIAQNYEVLTADIQNQNGPYLQHVFDLARVKPAKHRQVVSNILAYPDIYFTGSKNQNIENLVVAFMVSGGN